MGASGSGSPPAGAARAVLAARRGARYTPSMADAPLSDRRVVAALMTGLAVGGVAIAVVGYLMRPTETVEPAPPSVRPTVAVVTAIRELARLESATAHVERIVELTDTQERLFGLVRSEDTILLVAAADVTAGVDLAALGEDDVAIDERTGEVTITLPRAAVLTTAVDEARTYVHARTTDILAERREDLETLARREAQTSLEAAAVEGGLLTRADASAARTVEALCRSLGHERVTIRRAD